MALTKALTKKRRGSRRNQFGVTLADGPAEMLRASAKRRRMAATTLATELLEQALLERGGAGAKELAELREAIRALTTNHTNGLVALLAMGGLSAKEIEKWKKAHLKK